MTQQKIWCGKNFLKSRVLVLGESWYGTYEGELVNDAGWIQAYLDKRVTDQMYTKISNACGMSREEYWQGVAFTNFVQWVGNNPSDRPTTELYNSAKPRLEKLLNDLKPRAVWILGEEQAKHSKPVVDALGILCEVSWHPTRIGTTSAKLRESWSRLQRKLETEQEYQPMSNSSKLILDEVINDLVSRVKPKIRSNMKLVVSNLAEPLVVKKYKFPKSAPVYELTINGKKCQAANTQGGSPLRLYTYFIWEEISYYVPGHISPHATVIMKG